MKFRIMTRAYRRWLGTGTVAGLVAGLGLLLAGCDGAAPAPQAPSMTLKPIASVDVSGRPVQAASFLASTTTSQPAADVRLLATASELQVIDSEGQLLAQTPGNFSQVDSRPVAGQWLVATLDTSAQQVAIRLLNTPATLFSPAQLLPARDFALAGLCLYQDESANAYVFLVAEEGLGEQWLVADARGPLPVAQRVRSLPLPPEAEYCQADDQLGQLFVSEAAVGVWAYPAHPEAANQRSLVALRKPWGDIAGVAGALALVPGGILVSDPEQRVLHLYQQQGADWQAVAEVPLTAMVEPEGLSARRQKNAIELILQDDDGQVYTGKLDLLSGWSPAPGPGRSQLPVVNALQQTEPVAMPGDAADDPAIWVNTAEPEQSRILGTNKKQGLLVYGLDGRLLQTLPVGRLNNVDVRQQVQLNGTRMDLAAASNRDRNSISLFGIDPASGEVTAVGDIATELNEIYGICLYQPQATELFVFVNDKDGRFAQYQLQLTASGEASGQLVRQFILGSQPEGCVADDQQRRLFIGEEDVGLWVIGADASAGTEPESVLKVGDIVQADVEGVGLYLGEQQHYLVVSSQGNDSYVVLDAAPPYQVRGAFRVGLNGQLGIDGASETDGLEVTSHNLGGAWQMGMLVVQDGRKRMPEAPQNFKLIPWSAVAAALQLP